MNEKTYTDMLAHPTFDSRLEYLKLGGGVGRSTFGNDRYLNQKFYTSHEWKSVRSYVITRDLGCDLAMPGYEIHHNLVVHHINQMTVDDIKRKEAWILDPEFLITTTHATHNAIHYNSDSHLNPKVTTQRTPGDTTLW